ncbi:TraR/DksA family transcriptional regulator [Georgenia daeguensis]|uniref:Zinc finger DksA/TraR C4-type domain-containing protein n=1 Tax=Georgenia daeguensis TaxID=908355 RepID=A0ABP8EV10_9MICO
MTDGEKPDGTARERLLTLRAATEARLAALDGTFEEVVAASEGANADDEHDAEGTTIGYERAQVVALTESARHTLGEVDAALERLDRGTYGVCQNCGNPIEPGRLEARPTATLCVSCARAAAR